MLQVNGINQYYGGSHILRDVSFTAPVGACSVVLGRNGVGKTTLLKCLMGILPIKSGQILLNDQDISKLSPEQRVRAGLAYVPQGRDIFSTLTVEENIMAILETHMSTNRQTMKQRLGMLLDEFHIEHLRDNLGTSLSGGERRRVEIARAIAMKPRFLLLDEPFAGIDPISISDLQRLCIDN